MRTVLMLLALWGSVSAAAARRWARDRAVDRRDRQLRALLAGAVVPVVERNVVVPAPRAAADDQRAATTNSAKAAAWRPVAGSRTR